MSHRIVINGLSSNDGGSKAILINYVRTLNQERLDDIYIVLTNQPKEFQWVENKNITINTIPTKFSGSIFIFFLYGWILPKWLKKAGADLVFNLGDLIIRSNIPQIYLMDWPFFLFSNNDAWIRFIWRDRIKMTIKKWLIKHRITMPATVIVQTPLAEKKLKELCTLDNIEVIPNTIPLQQKNNVSKPPKKYHEEIHLLCLARYYEHKNLEALIPLAKRIKKRKKIIYKIIITIHKSQHPKASKLLNTIHHHQLDEVITNIGKVDGPALPKLYQSCDGLIMPTLLESFSATYVEAMYYGIPIFTSNRDFAQSVCRDAACYFDPLDPDDILNKLDNIFSSREKVEKLIVAGKKNLDYFPNPNQTFLCIKKKYSLY